MAGAIKPSAANIIAEFCGPNEPAVAAMACEVITSLAISKIRSDELVKLGGNPYLSDGFEGFEQDSRQLKLHGVWLSCKIDF